MARRPNILMITSDQQRGDAFGFEGRKVRTPHLDQLAADGDHRQPWPRMHQHPLPTDRRQQTDLCRPDDGAGTHRHVTGLHVIAGAPDISARAHPAQGPHPRLTAVGPAQRKNRVGQCGHRRAGLDPRGLPRLQPGGGAVSGSDRRNNRQAHITGAVTAGIGTQHVDAAYRITVDSGLVEPRQRAFGDNFFGAHQPLGFGNRHPNRPGCHRCSSYPSLLLFNRTHSSPFCNIRADPTADGLLLNARSGASEATGN